MHPVLLNIGSVPIHTYGFLIAIGFLIAVQVIKRLAEHAKLDVDRVLDLTFWSLMVGFIGARLLYVITQFDHFVANPLDLFKVWEGGLVFFGGPLAVIPFVAWFVRRHKLNLWRTMDCMVPGLVIAHAFGRMGCIAAGCCYGKPTGGEWGFKFYSELVDPEFRGIYLHPTQLYESTALLLLFIGLLAVFRRKVFDGQVVLTYFMLYPIIRGIIEIYRGDQVRGFVIDGWLSTSQFISALVFIGAAIFLTRRLQRLKA